MQDDLISVIVPVYKVEEYLDRCVKSIVNQTYKNLEIILVDDGSPDNCPEMCDEWANKDDRIKVLHVDNGGAGNARNIGLREAHGDWVSFIDSDDFIDERMFEYLLSLCDDTTDLAECRAINTYSDFADFSILDKHIEKIVAVDKEKALKYSIQNLFFIQTVHSKIIRSNIAKTVEFPIGKLIDDEYWAYKIIGQCRKLIHSNFYLYAYRQRGGSVMHIRYSIKRLEAIDAYCQRYKYIKENFPNLSDLALINVWYGCIYNGQQILLYLKGNEKQKALDYLKKTMRSYPLHHKNYFKEKLTQRLWLDMSRLSLVLTCKIRNFLKIGN